MKKVLVIFDCFGVLCDKVHGPFIEKYSAPENIKSIKENIIIPGDLGLIGREEFHKRLACELNLPLDDMIKEIDKLYVAHSELFPVIERIKDAADVALLSNALEGHAEKVLDGFNIRGLFDKIFLSYKCNMAKPDLEFYKLCMDSFGKKYDAVYMVDDTDENLEHLTEIGITPIKYIAPNSVITVLKKYVSFDK